MVDSVKEGKNVSPQGKVEVLKRKQSAEIEQDAKVELTRSLVEFAKLSSHLVGGATSQIDRSKLPAQRALTRKYSSSLNFKLISDFKLLESRQEILQNLKHWRQFCSLCPEAAPRAGIALNELVC